MSFSSPGQDPPAQLLEPSPVSQVPGLSGSLPRLRDLAAAFPVAGSTTGSSCQLIQMPPPTFGEDAGTQHP